MPTEPGRFLSARSAALVLGIGLAACGGQSKGASTSPTHEAHADAGATPTLETRPPPSGLPPMAEMPPPGVVGSRKAKLRDDAELGACSAKSPARAKDPAALLKSLGESCAAKSKMKPVGTVLRGQQADREAHQESKVRAEANHCYRLYVVSDESANDVVAVVRDSAGDIVAEAPAPAVPAKGVMCFQAPEDLSILVGVGNGKGAWAAQVWSD